MDLQVLAFLVHAWAVQPIAGTRATTAAAAAVAFSAALGDEAAPEEEAEEQLEAEGNLAGQVGGWRVGGWVCLVVGWVWRGGWVGFVVGWVGGWVRQVLRYLPHLANWSQPASYLNRS